MLRRGGLWLAEEKLLSAMFSWPGSVLAYLQLPTVLTVNYFAIGEQVSSAMLAGAACIVAANAIALGGKRPPAAKATDAAPEEPTIAET